MSALSSTNRIKVAKLLGMLGSNHAGERDAAGLAAHRIVTAAGLSWRQLITPQPVEKDIPLRGKWRQTCADCLAKPGSLKPWEVTFLRELPGFRRLSGKQRYILKEIADRVLGMKQS